LGFFAEAKPDADEVHVAAQPIKLDWSFDFTLGALGSQVSPSKAKFICRAEPSRTPRRFPKKPFE